jgi:hypothetical protein
MDFRSYLDLILAIEYRDRPESLKVGCVVFALLTSIATTDIVSLVSLASH